MLFAEIYPQANGFFGCKDTDVTIFRSFCSRHQNQMTYDELLAGLAAMDPYTPHGGLSGEMRCRYIFKFYAAEQDGVLSFEEFK